MAVLIAAAGVVWMIVCFENGFKQIKRSVVARINEFNASHNKDPNAKEIANICWQSLKAGIPRAWKDLLWSAVLMFVGAVVFTGVTGMMIGLIASILWSIWVQTEPLRKRIKDEFKLGNECEYTSAEV